MLQYVQNSAAWLMTTVSTAAPPLLQWAWYTRSQLGYQLKFKVSVLVIKAIHRINASIERPQHPFYSMAVTFHKNGIPLAQRHCWALHSPKHSLSAQSHSVCCYKRKVQESRTLRESALLKREVSQYNSQAIQIAEQFKHFFVLLSKALNVSFPYASLFQQYCISLFCIISKKKKLRSLCPCSYC